MNIQLGKLAATSLVSVLTLGVAFMGTSSAYFSDSASSNNNEVDAGTLQISLSRNSGSSFGPDLNSAAITAPNLFPVVDTTVDGNYFNDVDSAANIAEAGTLMVRNDNPVQIRYALTGVNRTQGNVDFFNDLQVRVGIGDYVNNGGTELYEGALSALSLGDLSDLTPAGSFNGSVIGDDNLLAASGSADDTGRELFFELVLANDPVNPQTTGNPIQFSVNFEARTL